MDWRHTDYLPRREWEKTRLADGTLVVPGLLNRPKQAYLLADAQKAPLAVVRAEEALAVSLPGKAPDLYNSVVVLDVEGKPDIGDPPSIESEVRIFVDTLVVDNREKSYTMPISCQLNEDKQL